MQPVQSMCSMYTVAVSACTSECSVIVCAPATTSICTSGAGPACGKPWYHPV